VPVTKPAQKHKKIQDSTNTQDKTLKKQKKHAVKQYKKVLGQKYNTART
jgi:hypothetical protein